MVDFTMEVIEKTNEDIYSIQLYDQHFTPYHLSTPMYIIA